MLNSQAPDDPVKVGASAQQLIQIKVIMPYIHGNFFLISKALNLHLQIYKRI